MSVARQRRDAACTPDMPLPRPRAGSRPIRSRSEIMWSRLITVVEEMWLTVCRTAFSLIISEAQDFACELLDPDGETLAHSPRAMPVFNLTLPRAVKALLERYPAETLKPGDVLITNDPWLCAGHLFDIAVVTPVFRDGRVVGADGHRRPCRRHRRHQGSPARPRDLRGRLPDPADEALRGREGQRGPGAPASAENVRNSEQVLGDIHSFVAANAIGAERLRRLHGRVRHARSAGARAMSCRAVPRRRCARRFARCRTASTRHGLATIRWARR